MTTPKTKRGRKSNDPRGPAETVAVKLGPTHRDLLRRLVRARGRKSSRSAVVREALEKMLD